MATMAGPLVPVTVIGSWSFPGWYEDFVKRASDNSLAFRTMVYIWSTHTTWLDIHMSY